MRTQSIPAQDGSEGGSAERQGGGGKRGGEVYEEGKKGEGRRWMNDGRERASKREKMGDNEREGHVKRGEGEGKRSTER